MYIYIYIYLPLSHQMVGGIRPRVSRMRDLVKLTCSNSSIPTHREIEWRLIPSNQGYFRYMHITRYPDSRVKYPINAFANGYPTRVQVYAKVRYPVSSFSQHLFPTHHEII